MQNSEENSETNEPEETGNDSEQEIETEGKGETDNAKIDESNENKPPKFKFECQRTGDCCKRETVQISFNDLQRWVLDQTIFRIMPLINVVVDDDEFKLTLMVDDDGYCSLYHRDNKACSIHYNKPLFCKSYPLGFNGENYIIKSNECTGLGKGKMTKESLKEMRDDAREDYMGRTLTSDVLPVLQGIFYKQMADESKKFMDALPEEDKEKLTKLFRKDDGGENTESQ